MALTVHTPISQCPKCGCRLDAATHPTEDVASTPGDISVCLRCQEILRFDDSLVLRQPSRTELDEIIREQPEIRSLVFRMQRAAAHAMDGRTKNHDERTGRPEREERRDPGIDV